MFITLLPPHAPVSVCSKPVTYDANGNTLSCDPDSPGPIAMRSIAYDPDVRREGAATDEMVKDHHASNRLVLRVGYA